LRALIRPTTHRGVQAEAVGIGAQRFPGLLFPALYRAQAKDGFALGAPNHTFGQQAVQVDIEIPRRAESLNERDAACVGSGALQSRLEARRAGGDVSLEGSSVDEDERSRTIVARRWLMEAVSTPPPCTNWPPNTASPRNASARPRCAARSAA